MEAVERMLIAIDGSEPSARALRMGVAMARKLGAAITIVHAIPSYDGPPDASFEAFDQAVERHARKMLEEAVVQTGLPAGEVSTVLLRGAPAEAVADEAVRSEADLVVVGSRGRSAMTRMLLGSTSDRLVHICQRPVLIVR